MFQNFILMTIEFSLAMKLSFRFGPEFGIHWTIPYRAAYQSDL